LTSFAARELFPENFLISPTFRWTLPPTFAAVPRSRISRSSLAFPIFSFTLPLASLILPLTLSGVLDFMNKGRWLLAPEVV
jgi:hypothetical protein